MTDKTIDIKVKPRLEERLAKILKQKIEDVGNITIFRTRARKLVDIIEGQKFEIIELKKEHVILGEEVHEIQHELKLLYHQNNHYKRVHLIAKIIMSIIVFACFITIELLVITVFIKLLLVGISIIVWVFGVNTIGYILETFMHINHDHHKI